MNSSSARIDKPLAGIHVALLSGFGGDGRFDQDRQRQIVERVLSQQVDGLYVGGSSGEAAFMTVEELLEQQRVVAEHARGRGVKLIAHVGQPSVYQSLRLAHSAESHGYDAVSALPPYAIPHTAEELINYYRIVAAATPLPLIVYEVPARTGRTTPLESILSILALPGVSGIKFTSADLYTLSRLRKHAPDATFFFGSDEMFGPAAAFGVDGGIGTTYNVLGSLYTALRDAVDAAELDTARTLQSISQDYVEALLQVGVIPGTKATLEALGIDIGPARAPLALRGSDPRGVIARAIEAPGFRDWAIRPT